MNLEVVTVQSIEQEAEELILSRMTEMLRFLEDCVSITALADQLARKMDKSRNTIFPNVIANACHSTHNVLSELVWR